jgi:MraZ protein
LGEKVALFLSTFVNKVDRKGRVSVPATFRAALATQRGIVAYPLDLPALECCGIDHMAALSVRFEGVERPTEEDSKLLMRFAESQELAFDGEGRIVLPAKFAQHAKIDIPGDAAFVGQGPMFQIWEPRRFEERRAAVRGGTQEPGANRPAPTSAGRAQ